MTVSWLGSKGERFVVIGKTSGICEGGLDTNDSRYCNYRRARSRKSGRKINWAFSNRTTCVYFVTPRFRALSC